MRLTTGFGTGSGNGQDAGIQTSPYAGFGRNTTGQWKDEIWCLLPMRSFVMGQVSYCPCSGQRACLFDAIGRFKGMRILLTRMMSCILRIFSVSECNHPYGVRNCCWHFGGTRMVGVLYVISGSRRKRGGIAITESGVLRVERTT